MDRRPRHRGVIVLYAYRRFVDWFRKLARPEEP